MPRKAEWLPVKRNSNDYCRLVKGGSATVWKNGEGSWFVGVSTTAPTEEEAKALAERLLKEVKP